MPESGAGEMRQQESIAAVKVPAAGYVWVMVVSMAGRLSGSNASAKTHSLVGSIEVTT